jgi:hypothetical protein
MNAFSLVRFQTTMSRFRTQLRRDYLFVGFRTLPDHPGQEVLDDRGTHRRLRRLDMRQRSQRPIFYHAIHPHTSNRCIPK